MNPGEQNKDRLQLALVVSRNHITYLRHLVHISHHMATNIPSLWDWASAAKCHVESRRCPYVLTVLHQATFNFYIQRFTLEIFQPKKM